MTEMKWLASSDPAAMLTASFRGFDQIPSQWVSDRKLRLFPCAVCLQVWGGTLCPECMGTRGETVEGVFAACSHCHGTGTVGGLTDPRSRQAVEVAERFADGEATKEELTEAAFGATRPSEPLGWIAARCCWPDAASGARETVDGFLRHKILGGATLAALLRCLFGNPWRPVTVAHDGWKDPKSKIIADWRLEEKTVFWKSDWKRLLVWNGGTVPQIARAIYEERDFAPDRLGVLCDALIEAGCPEEERCRHCEASGYHRYADFADGTPNYSDSAPCGWCGGDGRVPHPLLPHLRGPGPHAKGCWVVDLILGKS